jgi:hypothetical protein
MEKKHCGARINTNKYEQYLATSIEHVVEDNYSFREQWISSCTKTQT